MRRSRGIASSRVAAIARGDPRPSQQGGHHEGEGQTGDRAAQRGADGGYVLVENRASQGQHVDGLEAQLELIKQVGEQNYLVQQIQEGEDA